MRHLPPLPAGLLAAGARRPQRCYPLPGYGQSRRQLSPAPICAMPPAPACLCSMDGGMRDVLMAARAAATAAAEGQQQGDAYMERQSRRRWELIRMVVNFNKAHRWAGA